MLVLKKMREKLPLLRRTQLEPPLFSRSLFRADSPFAFHPFEFAHSRKRQRKKKEIRSDWIIPPALGEMLSFSSATFCPTHNLCRSFTVSFWSVFEIKGPYNSWHRFYWRMKWFESFDQTNIPFADYPEIYQLLRWCPMEAFLDSKDPLISE